MELPARFRMVLDEAFATRRHEFHDCEREGFFVGERLQTILRSSWDQTSLGLSLGIIWRVIVWRTD
jgi:hypothetical protein